MRALPHTSAANGFKGKPGDPVLPTWGLELDTFQVGSCEVRLFGLGGGKGIRGYWPNYYDDVHGVVFVVDSADEERLGEVVQAFKEVMASPQVQGKPVLVCANKQDLAGALEAKELASRLGRPIAALCASCCTYLYAVRSQVTPGLIAILPVMQALECRMALLRPASLALLQRSAFQKYARQAASTPNRAVTPSMLQAVAPEPNESDSGNVPENNIVCEDSEQELDPALKESLSWMLRQVSQNFGELNSRVVRDTAERKEKEANKSAAR